MRISNHDIVRTARQLRDEENNQLDVQPWNGHRHRSRGYRSRGYRSRGFAIPAWFVAIPAAAIIGFVFGFWTKSASQLDTPLTALVDTIYIKVHEPQPQQDTLAAISLTSMGGAATVQGGDSCSNPAARPAARSRRNVSPTSSRPQPSLGRPVSADHIRYDLLVRN